MNHRFPQEDLPTGLSASGQRSYEGWSCRTRNAVTIEQGRSVGLTACVHVLSSHTYLLTYSMVQSPSWEANWFASSQEIPRSSRNPKVHYRTHKRPPPLSILGQPNPVHIPTSHLLEIHHNIIHPSTLWSPQWSPSLRFPHPLSSQLCIIDLSQRGWHTLRLC